MNILIRSLNKSTKLLILNSARSISTSKPNNSSNIFNVQDENDFKSRVLENKKPVIVDFHAVWCGPCRTLQPRLEKIMASQESKADFAKVDIDQLPDIASQFNVQSVPTVMSFKNGKKLNQFIGLLDEGRIKQFVAEAIEK